MFHAKINGLRGRQPQILGHENHFESAVILPLVEIEARLCVLFEKRADNLLHQPGEISFPGGRMEPEDGGPMQAAVRETCEELNLHPEDIEVIAPLDIMVSPFNAIVYPFLARIVNPQCINPSADEVAEVFYIPVDFLRDYTPMQNQIWLMVDTNEDFPFDMIPHGRNYPFRKGCVPQFFYVWEERVIWGLTARILTHFLHLIKD